METVTYRDFSSVKFVDSDFQMHAEMEPRLNENIQQSNITSNPSPIEL